MKTKNSRLEALRLIIASKQMGSQEELLHALQEEGFVLTQATLSRDLKQLKVAKAATMGGSYVYVLPNEPMYKRVTSQETIREMMSATGYISLQVSGNMAVIRTRPGYASSLAWHIDNSGMDTILGTIAGDDTIFMVMREGATRQDVMDELNYSIPSGNTIV
ncbi:MAG: arginine repressor [Prevotella sp.]|nr:arginine repressor [Prevotella sp.]